MKKMTFSVFTSHCIEKLVKEGRFSTAHLYKNAMRSYSMFMKCDRVRFSDINSMNLKNFEAWLSHSRLKPNTISTYMRMLRSIYNKAVDEGYAKYVHRLFHHVYTGIDTRHKKALTRGELHALLYKEPQTDNLRYAQYMARLMFQLCGIPFVDLLHLNMSSIADDILEYHRMKTGSKVSIKLLDTTHDTIKLLEKSGMVVQSDDSSHSLFRVADKGIEYRSLTGFKQYQSYLQGFNKLLGKLGKELGISAPISTYTIRHSWATMAKYAGVPIDMISESLGHKSIKTTQIYLAGFRIADLAKMNRKVCSYIERI